MYQDPSKLYVGKHERIIEESTVKEKTDNGEQQSIGCSFYDMRQRVQTSTAFLFN